LLINYSIGFNICQQNISSFSKDDYLRKSKNQKAFANILLAGGGVLFITGSLTTLRDFGNSSSEPEHDPTLGNILLVTGLAAMVASVPFYIASSKNKKKAVAISFKNERAQQIRNNHLTYRTIPSLTVSLSLFRYYCGK
jgi:hypothetical protein